jgi:hypothetical protein
VRRGRTPGQSDGGFLPTTSSGMQTTRAGWEAASAGMTTNEEEVGEMSSLIVLKYQSGEEIKKGDRVLFHRESGQIELVAVEPTGDLENDWHMRKHGGGIMILEDVLGRTFIPADQISDCVDLEFVSRADAP